MGKWGTYPAYELCRRFLLCAVLTPMGFTFASFADVQTALRTGRGTLACLEGEASLLCIAASGRAGETVGF